MGSSSRRSFLQRLLGLLPVWGVSLSGARPGGAPVTEPDRPGDEADPTGATLAALAEVVLPAEELGPDALAAAIGGFEGWRDGLVPEAELDHPYLWSDELRYGPPDPRPRWRRQLAELDVESRRRQGRPFAGLGRADRERLLESRLAADPSDVLPHPGEAEHVALALMSWFFSTSEANDLCYRVAIGRHQCRGLPDVGRRPAVLEAPGRTAVDRRDRR